MIGSCCRLCAPQSPVRVGAGVCTAPEERLVDLGEQGQGGRQREVGERNIIQVPGCFWKQKNNLFLKQPDRFALEGLCVLSVCL